MGGLRQRLGKQLRVDGGGHHGLGADQASLDQQANSRSEKPLPLTQPGALAVHGHAAADHQVHGLQFAQRQSAARHAPSRDRGGAPRWDVEPRRVDEDEGTLVRPGWAQPCTEACRRPGRVPGPGAGGRRGWPDHPGRPPLRERGQPGSSEWSADELGDPSLGAREAGHRSRSRRAHTRSRTARLTRPTSSSRRLEAVLNGVPPSGRRPDIP